MTRDRSDATVAESWTVPDRRERPPSLASAPLFSPGHVLAERYELREILGRGGMGVVFEGYDRVLQQAIAIKIVRSEYAGDRMWAERLAREVKLARQINHSNVCRVFEFGIAESHPFLTMELASGGTLRDEMAAGQTAARPLEQRLSDAHAIASGLAAIHAAGIIHRDVAPQNVLRMADGRLVLSDFGLATDRFDGASSVHGGTVAYMAPEVVRGAHASIASDIWSLGVVIHEAVFLLRPQWSNGNKDIRPPLRGRRLLPAEGVVFEACRGCLCSAPTKRFKHAVDLVRWLERRRPGWRSVAPARVGVAAAAAVVILALGLALVSAASWHHVSALPAGSDRPPMLTPDGEPVDWTARSAVLAEVPDRIDCMVRLPDGESVRFVWGRPRHAEDVNVRSGRRIPSPIVAKAFAEGCPDTTLEGRVVFTGHAAGDRAFAFLSAHPDGRDAVPVVATAEPAVLSDPVWFPDGDRFEYEIDRTHAAVYSVSTKETAVIAPQSDFFTTFASVAAGHLVLAAVSYDFTTDVQVFSSVFAGPDVRFRVPFFVTRVESPDGRVFVMAESTKLVNGSVFVVDPRVGHARPLGVVSGQTIRNPVLLKGALAFLSMKLDASLVIKGQNDVPIDPTLTWAARCGSDIVAMRVNGRRASLVRLDEHGRNVGDLNIDGGARIPACSGDGRTLYYLADQPELRRCDGATCSVIARDVFGYSLAPDGQRIALITKRDPPFGLLLMDSRGAHRTPVLVRSMNPCAPSWQTDDLLWVSVRHGPSLVWEQLDVPSGKPTGRTVPGRLDCTDGREDPAAPFPPDVRIVPRMRYQVRAVRSVPGLDLGSSSFNRTVQAR